MGARISVAMLLYLAVGCGVPTRNLDGLDFGCTADSDCAPSYFCHAGLCRKQGSALSQGAGDGGGSTADASLLPAAGSSPDAGGPEEGADAGQALDADVTPDAGPSFLANGTSCGAAGECASGICTEGVCCDTACTGACQSCTVAGSVGTCSNLALGTPGRVSCGAYVCGGNATCPTSCASSSVCASGATCVSTGACLRKISTFHDDFNAGAADLSKWIITQSPGTEIRFRDGGVELTTAPNATGYMRFWSKERFDARDSSVKIHIVQAGNPSYNSIEQTLSFKLNSNTRIELILKNNGVALKKDLNGVRTFSGPYTGPGLTWMKIRESGGMTFFEYSTDGGTFSQLAPPIANPFAMDSIQATFEVDTYQAETGTTTVVLDDFNVP